MGGFAPGCAAVVATADRAAFCKVAGSVPNPVSLELYRGERARLAALPDHPALPKPLAATVATKPSALSGSDGLVTFFGQWAEVGDDPANPWRDEPWVTAAHLDRLQEVDARLQQAVVGSVPSHIDLRSDNILVGVPGHGGAAPDVWFVDWAAAMTAAPWVDRPSWPATWSSPAPMPARAGRWRSPASSRPTRSLRRSSRRCAGR